MFVGTTWWGLFGGSLLVISAGKETQGERECVCVGSDI
jgi:hypothetical protein